MKNRDSFDEKVKSILSKLEDIKYSEKDYQWEPGGEQYIGGWDEKKLSQYTAFVKRGKDWDILEIVLKQESFDEIEHEGDHYTIRFTYDGKLIDTRKTYENEGMEPDYDIENTYKDRLSFDENGLVVGGYKAIESMNNADKNRQISLIINKIEEIEKEIAKKIKESNNTLNELRKKLTDLGHSEDYFPPDEDDLYF